MIYAQKVCERSRLDFSDTYKYQYLLAERSVQLPGMDHFPFGSKTLNIGKKLHRSIITDAKGRFFGFVLGIAVDGDGLLKGERSLSCLDVDDPHVFARFAEYLDDVAGRYLFVCAARGEERIYTDPVAMIGCVFHRVTKRVASSLYLVLDDEPELNPKFNHEQVEKGMAKYAMFHTRDAHARRLNGSFFLDLYNLTETRFWPRTHQFEVPRADYGRVYDEIANTCKHVIGEITDHFKTAMPLSGGRDSRLLAGMAGEHMSKVTQVFTHITNFSTRYDASVAALMAHHLKVPHEIHSWRQPSPPLRSRFQYRLDMRGFHAAVGAPIRMPDEMEKNVHQLLQEDVVVMRGHLTDLLRAVYVFTGKRKRWKDLDWQMQRLFPVAMDDFDAQTYETLLPDFVAWRKTLPPAAMDVPVDFMFIEMYYNATVGFTFNGLSRQFYMSPFNSRRLIELSLAINVDYRRTMKPVDDILYRLDPGLCAVPYYKEAGADLAALSPDADWSEITEMRMQDVAERYERNYAKSTEEADLEAQNAIAPFTPYLKVANG